MEKPSNDEMVMDAFRLMRTGNYLNVKDLLSAFMEMYPDATKDDQDYVLDKIREIARKLS